MGSLTKWFGKGTETNYFEISKQQMENSPFVPLFFSLLDNITLSWLFVLPESGVKILSMTFSYSRVKVQQVQFWLIKALCGRPTFWGLCLHSMHSTSLYWRCSFQLTVSYQPMCRKQEFDHPNIHGCVFVDLQVPCSAKVLHKNWVEQIFCF